MKGYIFLILLLISSNSLVAQVTTATISGKISDSNDDFLIGASVIATHQPSGTQYGTISQRNGNFNLANLKPGGPYQVLISFIGFEEVLLDEIYLTLGESFNLDLALTATSYQLNSVEIVANRQESSQGAGVVSEFSKETIATTPSLNRSLQDITRLSPMGAANSFGGVNYRYNNLSIDGASHNDALGFQEPASGAGGSVASGTPGSLAGSQPISLDAIQAVQVAVSPFDVKQGHFTGANLNAVTRSGSNSGEGSVYWFGRNKQTIGTNVDGRKEPVPDFYDLNTGFRWGGALKKNKFFYFVNYEFSSRREPVQNVAGTEGSNIPLEIAQIISDTLLSRNGYDAGSFGESTNFNESHKAFVRLDYNLNDKHQLSLRHSLVDAFADNLDRSGSILTFSSQGFRHHSVTNSTVLELKSQFNPRFSNHLIVGYNRIEDDRSWEGDVFPHLEINYNTSNTIFIGPYREASIYGLSLGTWQFTDNLSWYLGDHTLSIGTQNDLYNIEYRFLTAWNGRWAYRSVEDFLNDQPSRIRGVYNRNDNSFEFNRLRPSADFRVMLLSSYVQDNWQVTRNLRLSMGLRMDMQVIPDKVPENPAVASNPAFDQYNNRFGGKPVLNPRIAVEYDLSDVRTQTIQFGSGLFSGRIPFAWYAYAYYISGNDYGNIDLRPNSPLGLERDLSVLRTQQPDLTEINLIEQDFQLPRTWRTSLTYKKEWLNGWSSQIHAIYSRNLVDLQFKSLNLKDSTSSFVGADSRQYYLGTSTEKKINPSFTNVFALGNTNKGYNYNLGVTLEKSIEQLKISTSYNYGVSNDVSNGVRNSLAANFNWNQTVDSNEPELSFSNFDRRHSVIITTSYVIEWPKQQTLLSAFFSANAGSPFSYIYAGDINRDGSGRNDLIYIPENQSDIVFQPYLDQNDILVSASEQWDLLDTFIANDPYLKDRRGDFAERNGARTPWNYQLDIRIAQRFSLGNSSNRSIELTLDIFNALALVNSSWGNQYFVPNAVNSSFQLLDFVTIQNEQPVFEFREPTGDPWQIDPVNSRWRGQLGLRYNF